MSKWNFSKEPNGLQPFAEADVLKSKRNVILTNKGWVRRQIKGSGRILDEVLVAAHPGSGVTDGYANSAYAGFPDIVQVYLGANTASGGAYQSGTAMNIYVVFNEPVKHSGLAAELSLVVSNTAGGNNLLAYAPADNSNTGIINANNTLCFTTIPGVAGTYKIDAGASQITNVTIGVAANVVSFNTGEESANLTITPTVSNTLSTFTVV